MTTTAKQQLIEQAWAAAESAKQAAATASAKHNDSVIYAEYRAYQQTQRAIEAAEADDDQGLELAVRKAELYANTAWRVI